MSAVRQSVDLDSMVPLKPYALSYSLPLLLFSALLTFAGAFLILDRTRSFPPRYDVIHSGLDTRDRKFQWRLEGGIGGLCAGYCFGGMCLSLITLQDL